MTHTHTPAVFAPYDSPLYVCSLALYALALDAACACGMLSYARVVALHVVDAWPQLVRAPGNRPTRPQPAHGSTSRFGANPHHRSPKAVRYCRMPAGLNIPAAGALCGADA